MNSTDYVDEATADLIFKLQLEDLEEAGLYDNSSHQDIDKAVVNTASDNHSQDLERPDGRYTGYTNQETDVDGPHLESEEFFENISTRLSDDCVSRFIREAAEEDQRILAKIILEETTILEDRSLALKLLHHDANSEHTTPAHPQESSTPQASGPRGPDSHQSRQRHRHHIFTRFRHNAADKSDSTHSPGRATSESHSSYGIGRTAAEGSARVHTDIRQLERTCAACQELKVLFDTVATPCDHNYCKDCIRNLFSTALTDESLFPPHCCGKPIPLAAVGDFLPAKIKDTFQEKEIEYNTTDRTYCHRSWCSAFIPGPSISEDIASCPKCRAKTCVTCKSAIHKDQDFPKDSGIQEVIEMAQQKGWQRCNACRRMVELETGCKQMTLVCPDHSEFD